LKKIQPFAFDCRNAKAKVRGVKQLDFLDFCEVAKLMNEGKHLTTEGLDLIRAIKNKMNTKRKYNGS
jgi:hypothetical protein